MENDSEAQKKLWEGNEDLLKKFKDMFAHHLTSNHREQLNEWGKIVSRSFLLALNRFKAIQYLTSPSNRQYFYIEAAILTRSLWENWLTLAWLHVAGPDEREERIVTFKNNSIISASKMIKGLKSIPTNEESDDEKRICSQAKEIRTTFPENQWEIPSQIKQMLDISERNESFKECVGLYYNTVYRDLSQYVHPSWRTIEEIFGFLNAGEISIHAHPSLKERCVSTSGGFLIYTAEIWNDVFNIITEELFEKWYEDWLKIQNECRNISTQ